MIKLGTQVKDNVSGLIGTAVSRTEWLNGCVQYGIQPKIKKGATEIPTWNVDHSQLTPLKKQPVVVKRKRTGGPTLKVMF